MVLFTENVLLQIHLSMEYLFITIQANHNRKNTWQRIDYQNIKWFLLPNIYITGNLVLAFKPAVHLFLFLVILKTPPLFHNHIINLNSILGFSIITMSLSTSNTKLPNTTTEKTAFKIIFIPPLRNQMLHGKHFAKFKIQKNLVKENTFHKKFHCAP